MLSAHKMGRLHAPRIDAVCEETLVVLFQIGGSPHIAFKNHVRPSHWKQRLLKNRRDGHIKGDFRDGHHLLISIVPWIPRDSFPPRHVLHPQQNAFPRLKRSKAFLPPCPFLIGHTALVFLSHDRSNVLYIRHAPRKSKTHVFPDEWLWLEAA